MSLAAGEAIGRYVLLEQLRRSEEATVWRAAPRAGGDEVALKLVPFEDVGAAARARDDAIALMAVEHPSISRCLDTFDDDERQLVATVFEIVAGRDLADLADDPGLSRSARIHALRHLASSLAHLHRQGLVHRDVRLENVSVTKAFRSSPEDRRTCKLVDLSVAVRAGSIDAEVELGQPGTLPFAAPEALDPLAFPATSAQPTLDVFAFGVSGWLLLNGRHPTGLPLDSGANDLRTFYVEQTGRAEDLVALGDDADPVERVLARCLRLRAEDRPQGGDEIVAELDQLVSVDDTTEARTRTERGSLVEPTVAATTGLLKKPAPSAAQRSRLPIVIAAVAVTGVAAAWILTRGDEAPPSTAPTVIPSASASSSGSAPVLPADVPSEDAWSALNKEVWVRYSDSLSCETKVIEPWFRMRCTPPPGTSIEVSWPEGPPPLAAVDARAHATTIYFKLTGYEVKVDLDWVSGAGKRTLTHFGRTTPNQMEGTFDRPHAAK